MKKLVSESLIDFRNKKQLNEGVMDNIKQGINWAKGILTKVGKFFFPSIGGQLYTNVNVPVNIGILIKDKTLNNNVIDCIVSVEDVRLSPDLASKNKQSLLNKYQVKDRKEAGEVMAAWDKDAEEWSNNLLKAINKDGEAGMDPNTNESYTTKFIKKYLNESKVELNFPEPKANVENIGTTQLIEYIQNVLINPEEETLFVWGAPGIGKTQIVNACTAAKPGGNARLIDIQTSKMRNDDWSLPYIAYKKVYVDGQPMKDAGGNDIEHVQAKDIAKSWIPGYVPTGNPAVDKKLDDEVNGQNGGILFLDELNRAYPEVLATCLKLVDERIIGNVRIGSKWGIIAASNRPGDDIFIGDWTAILGRRFHNVNFVPTFDEWKIWAYENDINPEIMTFLEFNKQYFYHWDAESYVNASPSDWHRASKTLKNLEKTAEVYGRKFSRQSIYKAFSSTLGTEIGGKLVEFLRVLEIFRPEDIKLVFSKPDKAPIPNKQSMSEATAFIAAVVNASMGKRLTPKEFTNYCKYLVRLDNSSVAGVAIQMITKYHEYLDTGMGDDTEIKMINKDTGETSINDEFVEGINIFIKKYKDFY